MPRIEINAGAVSIVPGVDFLEINLDGYVPAHRVWVLNALVNSSGTTNILCKHITTGDVMDAIIDVLLRADEENFMDKIIFEDSFLNTRQIKRLLSTKPPYLVFSNVSIHPGGAGQVVDFIERLDQFHLIDCRPEFVHYILSIIRVRSIGSFSLLEKQEEPIYTDALYRFMEGSTIEELALRGIDIPALFGDRGGVVIHDFAMQFDWMTDRETAIRYADAMYGLHRCGLQSFENYYLVPPGFKHVSDRLQVFARRTFNRFAGENFRVCSFRALAPEVRLELEDEQRKIQALPYGIMLIMLAAKQRGEKIGMLSTDPFTRIGEMLGMPPTY